MKKLMIILTAATVGSVSLEISAVAAENSQKLFIAFNTRPEDSADAAARWLKGD